MDPAPGVNPEAAAPARPGTGGIRPWRLVLAVLTAVLLVSALSRWYAREVSLPRYCDNPEQTLARVARLLTEDRPAGEGARRAYVIDAKLLFLVPQQAEEANAAYLERLRHTLGQRCR